MFIILKLVPFTGRVQIENLLICFSQRFLLHKPTCQNCKMCQK